jgi:hypothetical protein
MLLTKKQLREGKHLRLQEHVPIIFKNIARGRPRKKRYALCLPGKKKPWTKKRSSALQHVFGTDALGTKALSLFQTPLQP